MNFLPRSLLSLRAKNFRRVATIEIFSPPHPPPDTDRKKKRKAPDHPKLYRTANRIETSWKVLRGVNVPWRTRTRRTRFPECLIHRRLFAQLLRPRARGSSNFATAVTKLTRTRKLALRRPDLSRGVYHGTTDPRG